MEFGKEQERLLSEAIKRCETAGNDNVKAVLVQLLTSMQQADKIGKFKLFDYTLRPNAYGLGGVYYENGYMNATDTRILLHVKADYPEQFEKRLVQKNGESRECRYPNVFSVVPKDRDTDIVVRNISVPVLKEAMKYRAVMKKTNKDVQEADLCVEVAEGRYFATKYVKMILDAVCNFGLTDIRIIGEGTKLIARHTDGQQFCLCMCVNRPEDAEYKSFKTY